MISEQYDLDDTSAGRPDVSGRVGAAVDTAAVVAAMSGCEKCLREGGIMGALRFLNGRTRYRYTGLYHAEPPVLRNVHLFDRENPTLNVSGELKPLHETYCAITRETDSAFRTPDALVDARLVAHPARESILSYCGVPLHLGDGPPWGSLCHFDVRPRLLSTQELQVLEGVAPLFARWLAEHTS